MIILEKKFDNLKGGLWNQRRNTIKKGSKQKESST